MRARRQRVADARLRRAVEHYDGRRDELVVALASRLDRHCDAPAAGLGLERKGLTRSFSLLGLRDDLPELLASASLTLVPSQTEGIPLIVLESLAMETPVVASQVGAIEEALPPECGILVDLGSEEELRYARAIDALLTDEQRRREMGQAGRQLIARDYTIDRARRQYTELLNELDADLKSP